MHPEDQIWQQYTIHGPVVIQGAKMVINFFIYGDCLKPVYHLTTKVSSNTILFFLKNNKKNISFDIQLNLN